MTPAEFEKWLADPHRAPLVMGVLNVTPDSFSDGAQFVAPERALSHAEKMVEQGADWIDVGAESTRPGAERLPADVQLCRLRPVLSELRKRVSVVLSIDTTMAQVAREAMDAGVNVVNDISAGRDDPALLPLVAQHRAAIVLMHMQGEPATMQVSPHYSDVTKEVSKFLSQRISEALRCGIARESILIDPGIGFGKTVEHNLQLLRDLASLQTLGQPIVVGTSRKGFLGKVTGESAESGRPMGTAASIAWAVANGAAVVRVHDVGPMSQVVRMVRAIQKTGS